VSDWDDGGETEGDEGQSAMPAVRAVVWGENNLKVCQLRTRFTGTTDVGGSYTGEEDGGYSTMVRLIGGVSGGAYTCRLLDLVSGRGKHSTYLASHSQRSRPLSLSNRSYQLDPAGMLLNSHSLRCAPNRTIPWNGIARYGTSCYNSSKLQRSIG